MPISVTLPTWIPRNRVITFDEGALETCGVTIPYSEITGLRLFSVDSYNHGTYVATKYVIEITSEHGRKIKCQYSDGQGTAGAESYKLIQELIRYYIVPGLLNRLVAKVQNQRIGGPLRVGPLVLTFSGIRTWKYGVIPQSLSWEHFAGCRWIKGRIQILQRTSPGQDSTVWWSGRHNTKQAFILSNLLSGCYRVIVLGDSTPFVHSGPAPQSTDSPEVKLAAEAVAERTGYHHRMGMKLGLFIIAMIASTLVAALGACILAFLSIMGWYVFIIFPIFLSLGIVIAQVYLLKWAHCRNGWAAIFFALVVTMVFYFGQYYAVMVYYDPSEWVYPRNAVNQFIYEMNHTVIAHNGIAESSPNPVMVITLTIVELGIVYFMITISALGQAAAPYCEESRNWMIREVARFPSGKAKLFLVAFSQLNGQDVMGLPFNQSRILNSPHTRVAVEYSPRFEGHEPLNVFLSVGQRQSDGILQPPGANKGDLIKRLRFRRAEVEQVLPIFRFISE